MVGYDREGRESTSSGGKVGAVWWVLYAALGRGWVRSERES